MRKFLLVGLGVLFCICACDTPSDSSPNCDFDQKAMLTNYADELIIPRFSNLKLGLLFLESSVQAFVANPTPDLLGEIQVSFGATYLAYQECSMFAFGPGLVGGAPFRERMNTFPANSIGIDQNISNANSVSASANSTVGFPAVEYLLFGNPGMTTADVLILYENNSNRIDYLIELVEEMKMTIDEIEEGWSVSGGNYRQEFIDNVGTAVGSSISLMLNEFNYDFEILKNFKFKIPLGKLNGGTVLPEKVEGYYSNGAVQLATRHIEALKEFYIGEIGGQEGRGVYAYVACLKTEVSGELLADAIVNQFDEIIEAVSAVPNPMSETLVNDKPVVENAYTQMQMLVLLIKHEMTSSLGVQISYQDNDGD